MNIFELNIYLDYFVSKNSFIKDPRTLNENYVLVGIKLQINKRPPPLLLSTPE